jgi:hypothetical protein
MKIRLVQIFIFEYLEEGQKGLFYSFLHFYIITLDKCDCRWKNYNCTGSGNRSFPEIENNFFLQFFMPKTLTLNTS